MGFSAELMRITLEVIGLGVIVAIVASTVSRRRSILSGAVAGTLTAAVLWIVIVFIELRWFARWY